MKRTSIIKCTRAISALICLWWPMVAVSAFASHHTTSSTSSNININPSTLQTSVLRSSRANKHHQRHNNQFHKQSATKLHLTIPRGGATAAAAAASSTGILSDLSSKLSTLTSTPTGTFNTALVILGAATAVLKIYNKVDATSDGEKKEVQKKDPKVKSLQMRFLAVFWLLRMADWLQGPYFYQVYASKTFTTGATTAMTWVSRLFLTGFASTALFGPLVGRLCDSYGRKAGTLVFALLYSLGASSTKSNLLGVLLLGRVLGGIGTSLLFSAPEAWLVGEAGREGVESSLGETFGLAYAGDSIVAILAGQMAGAAASTRGPTGPFELSVGFLVMGGLLASLLWKENVAGGGSTAASDDDDDGTKEVEAKPTIRDAVKVVKEDPKIMLVGAIQSLFEAAMYIFVLNWPPAVSKAVSSYFAKFAEAGASIGTPYGTVFSCFMACCLLGSTVFGQLTSSAKVDKNGKSKAVSTENFAVGMLGLAALAMGSATLSISSSTPRIFSAMTSLLPSFLSQPGGILSILMLSLFLFESCVGMYFPTIGTLRSKYFPDSHRSVVMNLFGIPLNVMVVTVFLSIEKLGVQGALGVSTGALAIATACGLKLKKLISNEEGNASPV